MDRRDSIKSMVLASLAGGLALQGCKPDIEAPVTAATEPAEGVKWRTQEENKDIEQVKEGEFLNQHERETLGVLCDLILPKSDTFASATEADVVEFIEFTSLDIPEMQNPLRGGLMWLDHESNSRFNTEFKTTSNTEQKEILDDIAYYDPTKPQSERSFETNWFSLVRNLTMTGFYTSEIGIKEIGYKGNQPNVWDGVPQDVLDQHGVAYEEEWLAKCLDPTKAGDLAEWDENGNLLT